MRAEKLLALASLSVVLAGCVDGPVSVLGGGDGGVLLAPQFSFNGAMAGLPIEYIDLRSTLASGEPLGQFRDTVDASDATWNVELPIDLGSRDTATILVYVEMVSVASGAPIVEWSGIVGPLHVTAGTNNPVESQVQLVRGPLENQLVDLLVVSGPGQLSLGQTHPVFAFVETRGTSHTVIWTSSDPSVLQVDPVGDSVDVFAAGGGSAMIIAAAGTRADTLHIFVDDTPVAPVADVVIYPDSSLVIISTTRVLQAYAMDASGIPVGAAIAWESLEPGIATVTGTGVVTGVALGNARIVASAAGHADTAIVTVGELPPGVDMMWQGGTPNAVDDWFTAENWTPAVVPSASSVIYLPWNAYGIMLTADAEVGSILADSVGSWIDVGAHTLTVHGDVLLIYTSIYGDSTGRLVIDAPRATLSGAALPSTTLLGAVTTAGDVIVYGDLRLDGSVQAASLDIGPEHLVAVYGSAFLTNANLVMRADSLFNESYFYVEGDLAIDGGDSSNSLTGGWLSVGGDFIVTATTCTAFAPTGTEVQLYSADARISMGCSGLTGNRFHDLFIYSATGAERLLHLESDIWVTGELYLDGGSGTRVFGAGVTIHATEGSAYVTVLDRVFLDIEITQAGRTFWMDSVTFTGMTGEQRPQLRYVHPGEPCACYSYNRVLFDQTAAGPYLEVIDATADADSLTLYMAHNPGDGPQRTVTSGGARVYWADVPVHLVYGSGSGQLGLPYQPLADSLRAEVVDYAWYPVVGIQVDWTVVEGDGSVSPATSTTGADGLAATQFTVGDTMFASHVVTATSPALPADTVYYYGYPSASQGGSPGAAAGRAPASAVRPEPQAAPTSIAEPTRRQARVRPDRPYPERPLRSDGGRR